MRSLFSSILVALICLASGQGQDQEQGQVQGELPRVSYVRTFQTPYMYQINPRYAGDGSMFCGPTAATMGLAWLAEHGFPNLMQVGQSQRDSLQHSVETLASENYMNTGLKSGTNATEIVDGLNRYISDAGYRVQAFEYSGIRPPKTQVPWQLVSDLPSLDLLRKGVNSPTSIVLLNLGYYNQVGPNWRRMNGHWVLSVGYGATGTGQISDQAILVHNPAVGRPRDLAPRSELARRLSSDVAVLTPISGGIVNTRGQLMRTADGLFAVEGLGVPKSRRFDATVLDGIVVVTLEPSQR